MPKGAPSDDFFGIEYVSTAAESEKSTEAASTSKPRIEEKGGAKQLEGSKFVDETFFPEMMGHSSHAASKVASCAATDRLKAAESAEQQQGVKEAETGSDYLDRAYFAGRGLSDSDKFYEQMGRQFAGKHMTQEELQEQQAGRRQHELFYDDLRCRQAAENDDGMVQAEPIRPKVRDYEVRKEKKPRKLTVDDLADQMSALDVLRLQLPDLSGLSSDTLADMLADRVIYSDSALIAFDKPYGLPYAGTTDRNRPQFDRLLQDVKARVAPKVERLHLVRPLDSLQSGVILFATSKLAQTEALDMLKEATLSHRCLVRGVLDESLEVTVPLVRKQERAKKGGQNFKLLPLFTNKTMSQISHGTTLLKPLKESNGITYLEAETRNEVPHQLRCHLALAKVPLIGDAKYAGYEGMPPKLPAAFLETLSLSVNQGRKLPSYSHLLQMRLPSPSTSPVPNKPDIVIRASLPRHFAWILQKLKFVKR